MEFYFIRYLIFCLSRNGLVGFDNLVVIVFHDLKPYNFFSKCRQLFFLFLFLLLKKLKNWTVLLTRINNEKNTDKKYLNVIN